MCVQSYPTLCDPWTTARQAPLFMGFSRQEYWSGLPFPSLLIGKGRIIYTHIEKFPGSPTGLYFPLQEAQVQSLIGERRYHKVWGVAEKESVSNERDPALTPGSGRFSREGNGNPLEYSCLENTMDRRAW